MILNKSKNFLIYICRTINCNEFIINRRRVNAIHLDLRPGIFERNPELLPGSETRNNHFGV